MLPIYLALLIGVGMIAGSFSAIWIAREEEGNKGMIAVAVVIFVMLTAAVIFPVIL